VILSAQNFGVTYQKREEPMSSVVHKSIVQAQPIIAVRNVRASSRWYAQLLGADSLPEHQHRDVYDRITSSGQLILQLHAWDEENHPNLVNASAAPPGHGVLLWFQVDDFDSAAERARALRTEIIGEPHVNPRPQHREMWLRDPDGYVVVIASPDGESSSQSSARDAGSAEAG
jgi:extradiol dioxygenase family protein